MKLRVLDLFSGIGGFSLGLERTGGFETVAFCEIEEFPRRVLRKHWPEVPIYEDARTLTADTLRRDGIAVDVITGGFPCQDISVAGRQAGIGKGTRSGLWSEIVRLNRDLRPDYLIVENVANLLSGPSERRGGWFGRILGDLAECGYDAEWENIPASAVGAPHLRERIWIVAYPKQKRCDAGAQIAFGQGAFCDELRNGPEWQEQLGLTRNSAEANASDAWEERTQRVKPKEVPGFSAFSWCQDVRRIEDLRGRPDLPPPLFFGSRDGVPNWVDRVGSCGNAVVPQIPEMIGHAILAAREAS